MGLVCDNGLCVEQSVAPPPVPAEKTCYTPCSRDLVAQDGSVKKCESDGLLKGCIAELECTDGSCVKPGEDPSACEKEMDCPVYQTCIQGHCYSNCETNADCQDGRTCYKHVCRQVCDLEGQNPCPRSYACSSSDGENGVCLPVAKPGKDTQKDVPGSFELSKTSVEFSNVSGTAFVTIRNQSNLTREYVIHKRSHVRYLPGQGDPDMADDPP
jgi:hypothetical protein